MPLNVKLNGNCIDLPDPTDTLRFECPVRKNDHKKIMIHNSYVYKKNYNNNMLYF